MIRGASRARSPVGLAATPPSSGLRERWSTGKLERMGDGAGHVRVPGTYRERWLMFKPLDYADRSTVVNAGLRPVRGITPELAACAIAYGRYARRSFLGGPIVLPTLLLAASYILGHPGLRSSPALIGGCGGMALLAAAVWRRSRRADEANWETIRSGTAL